MLVHVCVLNLLLTGTKEPSHWKRWNFRWHLKVDRVSIERMCAGKEFQVEGADTEKAREEKLLAIQAGLVRRFVLEERNDQRRMQSSYCNSLNLLLTRNK